MQSSMQVTLNLRMKRVVRANLDALDLKSYDDLVERINTYSEFDKTVYMGELIMGCVVVTVFCSVALKAIASNAEFA